MSGVLVVSGAGASSYDDCVLSGMRGVASDVAARAVLAACKSKEVARAGAIAEARFGPVLDTQWLRIDHTAGRDERGGFASIVLRNLSGEGSVEPKTLTAVKLAVRARDYDKFEHRPPQKGVSVWDVVDEQDAWRAARERVFFFIVEIPAGRTRRLAYPEPKEGDSVLILEARGRRSSATDRLTPSGDVPVKPEGTPPW